MPTTYQVRTKTWSPRLYAAALIVGLLILQGAQGRAAFAGTRVREALCRFSNRLKPATLPKTGLSVGIAELDTILSRFSTELVQRIPGFQVKGLSSLPPLAKLTFSRAVDLDSLESALSSAGFVEYITPNHVYKLCHVPNDSAFFAQWVPKKLQLPQVWDQVRGSPDVVVGIVDTGIDPSHPDLMDAIWINPGEDLNGDGRFSHSDLNGIDDDGNGLVDDVWGWDFVDAPRFPDGGDYLDPDNEPIDENGHGTSVAGIVGATGDNGIGVAGVAYGTKLMILRAGTSRGLLEEDDVASAILYAVEMGARVINMSFGDTELAPFLEDVIAYAHSRGVTLVASAGNSGDNTPHYPAGLAETISVGASTESDEVAAFSSFGETVDLVAPGVSVLTTALGGTYRRFDGTSASAPVVSAVCALLLARDPSLQPEQLRGKLASSAVDIWISGWDRRSGSGRVNPLAALGLEDEVYAQITRPCSGCVAGNTHDEIRGTASGPGFARYRVLLGRGATPTDWDTLSTSSLRVVDGVLATWRPELLPEDTYVVRLVVEDLDGRSQEDRVQIRVDHSRPNIWNVSFLPMVEEEWPAALLSFNTSDLTRARFRWRPYGTREWLVTHLQYLSVSHHMLLSEAQLGPDFEYEIEVENLRGQTTTFKKEEGYFRYRFPGTRLATDWFVETLPRLPTGYLCPNASDINGNGLPEVLISPSEKDGWGPLQVWEWDGASWTLIAVSGRPWLPRDASDINGDGRDELLVGWGDQSGILTLSPVSGKLEEIWRKDDDFWAARFVDLDGDGNLEIAARWRGDWSLWEKTEDTGFALWVRLPNPTAGDNTYTVPRIGYGDTNGNGLREICFADEDGDLLLYELTPSGKLTLLLQLRTPLPGASPYVDLADLDGDGDDEVIVGCHSEETVNREHEFDTRHWVYRVYRHAKINEYTLWAEWRFFGYYDDQGFKSSAQAADVNLDGLQDLLICTAPDFYLASYDPDSLKPALQAFLPEASSNAVTPADFDGDGVPEIALGGPGMVRFLKATDQSVTPAPLRVCAVALDESSVLLRWDPVRSANTYEIFRQEEGQPFVRLTETPDLVYTDTTVTQGKNYRYRVRSLGAMGASKGARVSNVVRPHVPPSIARAEQAGNAALRISFTQPMGGEILDPGHFAVRDPEGRNLLVASVARGHRFSEVLLTLREPFTTQGFLTVTLINVADTSGTPIRPNPDTIRVWVRPLPAAPYVVTAEPASTYELILRFNTRMRPDELADPSNYRVHPMGRVVEARPLDDGRAVRLKLSKEVPLLPLGKTYRIVVGNVHNLAGVRIRAGIGDRVELRLQARDLSGLVVYPNPWRPDLGSPVITFGGVPRGAEVFILDALGRVLRKLEAKQNTGGVTWDLTNESGEPVASGVYVYWVRTDREQKLGKFAIVR